MTNFRKTIGALGERLAQTKLVADGYTIIETNWRCQAGEMDIIARHGVEWIFIEVKTRTSTKYGSPEDSVDQRKQTRLARIAECYLDDQQLDAPWRIDMVAVEFDSSRTLQRITHHIDIVGW